MGLNGTHLRVSHEVLKISILKPSLKNTLVKLLPHLAEANELIFEITLKYDQKICFYCYAEI